MQILHKKRLLRDDADQRQVGCIRRLERDLSARSGGAPAAASPAADTPSVVAPGLSRPQQPSRLSYSAPTVDGEAQVERRTAASAGGEFGKVGRNAPCPCGSGRKYKLCHGDPRNRSGG